MAKDLGIGIGIGVVIGIALTFSFVAFNSQNQGTTIEAIPDLILADDPQFARLQAVYDEFDDKTTVFLIFTDKESKYVRGNGDVKVTLCQEIPFEDRLHRCFSNDFAFTKSDFYSWIDQSGEKITGRQFVINGELSGGWWWQASADITLDDGKTWGDVDTRFYALED